MTPDWRQVAALLAGGAALGVLTAAPRGPHVRRASAGGQWPITSPFGMRMHPTLHRMKLHEGLDLGVPQGTPIVPVGPGRVIKVSPNAPIGGTSVTVDHGGGFRSSYSHLSAVYVQPGQTVHRGAPLGLSGGTPGTWGAGRSTGPHLHLQIWRLGPSGWTLVDPAPLIRWS